MKPIKKNTAAQSARIKTISTTLFTTISILNMRLKPMRMF